MLLFLVPGDFTCQMGAASGLNGSANLQDELLAWVDGSMVCTNQH